MKYADIVANIIKVLGNVVFLIMALAVFLFFYGIVKYISSSGDESERKEGVQYIVYGLIGLFVMISVWGLVALFSGVIDQPVSIPQIN